jgi:ketosteroid isomerase-like protein
MRPLETVVAFVGRINARDLDGLAELMTDDHLFVDALDNRVAGRDAMRRAWEQYFSMVPDYSLRVEQTFEHGSRVALFGVAGGTYEGGAGRGKRGEWSIPAAWLAETWGDRVSLWRVYADNLPIRRLMNAEQGY